MNPITEKQYETLIFIRDYMNVRGRPPTIKVMALEFGITDSAVSARLKRLAVGGYVKHKPRFPVILLHVPNTSDERSA